MERLQTYEEFEKNSKELRSQRLLEFRNVPKIQETKVSMKYGTIRKILDRTAYVPGESLYLYNVVSYLMIKRI